MAKIIVRHVVGWIFILLGIVALVMPVVPGAILVFLGLEVLGIRLAFWDKLKTILNGTNTKK